MWRRDLIAGLTVAVVTVPQSIAFALIAGVPASHAAQYGLYTAIIQGIVGSLFSSSDHLSTGPTNTQSLLAAATVNRIAGGDPNVYLQLVVALTMLKGLIQMAFAVARMGRLVRYVSQSVFVGFTAGAGVLIITGQVPSFLGIQMRPDPDQWPGTFGLLRALAGHLDQVNCVSVMIGMLSLAVVVVASIISQFVPGPLLAIVFGALFVLATDCNTPQIGEVLHTAPRFVVPSIQWPQLEQLLGGALALALLGMLETVAIGRSIAAHTGQRISPNRELFGQGVAQITSSFAGAIPGSGSFSRSALNFAAGAQSRFASVYCGLFVAATMWLFLAQAKHVPLASLAAILFVIAYRLIDWRSFLRVCRTNRADAVVCVITFLATLFMSLQYAIYVGILLNIALYLRRTSQLHMAEMVPTSTGPFIERPIQDRAGNEPILFLQMEGDLFFGIADELQDRLNAIANKPSRAIIFRLKRTHSIDSTVLGVLEQFVKQMQAQGRHVLLCGVRPELVRTLLAFGLMQMIGEDNVFETTPGIFTSAKHALRRAQTLLDN